MTSVVPYRVGEWLESDTITVNNWVGNVYLDCLRLGDSIVLHPVVVKLKNFLESDEKILGEFKAAFAEIPEEAPYNLDVMGNSTVRDYTMFLKIVNQVITIPPRYENNDFVGFPIFAVINWCMCTPTGTRVFLNPDLNKHFKLILNEWAAFLRSPESRQFLTTSAVNGWFSECAVRKALDRNGKVVPFEDLFVCDPGAPFHGFSSWDAYFTRQFVPCQRPIVDADNDSIITNSCEASPYRVAKGIKREDEYWIKGQPYSLLHMLQDDEAVDYFVGGTLYQSYLSAMNYHRWHSPVNGRVVRTKTIDGAFYPACLSAGYDPTGCWSQSYLTEVATRSLVFIECANPRLGLLCFMAVGMGEVSTCEVTVAVGQQVRKGDELGMFHFGGSTVCLLVGPAVELSFDFGAGNEPGLSSRVVQLNRNIATLSS